MAPTNRSTFTLVTVLPYGILTLMGLVLVAPFAAFVVNAFATQWFFPQFLPETWTLGAWERLFAARSEFSQALASSTLIAVVVTLMSLGIGLPAARVLGLYAFRGKRVIEFLLLLPAIAPPLAISMGLTINFLRWGLAGHWVGVSIAHLVPVLPYVVLILSGTFANYDVDHEQQARTLGAKPITVFWRITLPMIRPGLIVAGLFAFLISWSQYILTLLVGTGHVMTLPILLFSSAAGGNNTVVAAQALMFVAPTLLLLVFTSRLLAGNAAAGLGRL